MDLFPMSIVPYKQRMVALIFLKVQQITPALIIKVTEFGNTSHNVAKMNSQ
jgi:hypothetical protein